MIVVTGATGQLGGAVVRELLSHVPAEEIAVSVRSPEKAAELAAAGVAVRRGDYDEPGSLPGAFAGADRLLFVSSPEVEDAKRIPQHLAVLRAAKDAGVGLVVYTSLFDAANSPLFVAGAHRATEEAIRESGLPFVVLRNSIYADAVLIGTSLRAAVESGEIVTSAEDGLLNSALRQDMAVAAANVLTQSGHQGAVYELTGPVAWSFDDLATALSKVSGKPVQHRRVSDEEAEDPRAFLFPLVRAGHFSRVTGDLERLLGRPATSLEQSVELALRS